MKFTRLVAVAATASTVIAGATTAADAQGGASPYAAVRGHVSISTAATLDGARPQPRAVRRLTAYQDGRRVTLSWNDPAAGSFQRVVVRYRVGHHAPAGPRRGLPADVSGSHATTAVLHQLTPNTPYAVGVWTVAAGRASKRVDVSFRTAGPPPGPPAADAVISGIVTDTSGSPLAGAVVIAESDNRFGLSRDRTVTDSTGHYTLHLARGRAYLFFDGARATGGASDATGYVGDSVRSTLTAGEHIIVDRALAPGAALTGRVVDASGEPVDGAAVFATYPDTYVQVDRGGDYSFFSIEYLLNGAPRTGPRGRFRLTGLAPAALRVCAQQASSSPQACTDQPVLATAGNSHDAGVIALPSGHTTAAGGAVAGRVVDSAGHPVRRADIFLVKRRGSSIGDAQSDANGHYRMTDLAPGRYEGCIGAPAYRPRTPTGLLDRCVRGVRVEAGRTTRLPVVMRTGAAASGVVRTPAGRPVPHGDVELSTRNGGLGVIADAHGRFNVTGLPAGRYRICTGATASSSTGSRFGYSGRCDSRRVTLHAGRRLLAVSATVAPAGAIAGRITTSGSGNPGKSVFALRLTGQGAEFDDYEGRIQSDGRFRVTGLAPGRYLVCPDVSWADGASVGNCRRRPTTVQALHTSQYGTLSVAAGSVSVTVRDADGTPIAAVDTTAVAPCHSQFGCDHLPFFPPGTGEFIGASLMTGSHGHAQLNGLTPGHYAVCGFAYLGAVPGTTPPTGFADGCSGDSFDITVTANQVAHYTLTLATAGALTGTVTDTNGDPLQGVFVHVTGSAATDTPQGGLATPAHRAAVTGTDGTFTVRSVTPGDQVVCFRASHARDSGGPVAVQDQCFGGQPGQSDGAPVTVTSGQVTSGVDIALTAKS